MTGSHLPCQVRKVFVGERRNRKPGGNLNEDFLEAALRSDGLRDFEPHVISFRVRFNQRLRLQLDFRHILCRRFLPGQIDCRAKIVGLQQRLRRIDDGGLVPCLF